MMKKSIISLVTLSAAVALSGCTPTAKKAVEKPGVARYSHAMLIGDTHQIDPYLFDPIEEKAEQLVYTSDNESIAKVSNKGVVKAIGEGLVNITVTKKDTDEVVHTLPIYVTPKVSSSKAKAYASRLKAKQTADKAEAKKLIVYETYRSTTTANDELFKQSTFVETFTSSKADAFFYIGGADEDIKNVGGSAYRSQFGYYVFTNPSYDSWIYHYSGDDVKNKLEVSTQNYIGTETTRFEVVCKILASLFTSGSDIVLNGYKNVVGQDDLDDISGENGSGAFDIGGSDYKIKSAGLSEANGDFVATVSSGGTYAIGNTQESDWEIPAGTKFTYNETITTHWRGDYVKFQEITVKMVYTLNKIKYVRDMDITYSYVMDDDVVIERPNKDDYTTVRDVYDL